VSADRVVKAKVRGASSENYATLGLKMKRILSTSLRIGILIGLLGCLIYFHFIDFAVLGRVLRRPDLLVIGIAAVQLSYAIAALRWWIILSLQKIAITYRTAFQLFMISVFTSIFVPGGTASADAARMLLLMRVSPAQRGQPMLSVFADRFIAVLALSLLAAILTLVQSPFRAVTPGNPLFWLDLSALLLPLGLVFVVLTAWLISRTANDCVQSSEGKNWIQKIISAVANFFDLAIKNWLSMALAVGAGFISAGLLVTAIVIVSAVAAIPILSPMEVAHAATLSQFVNGLPISPAGIGVGEVAFNQICVWIAQGKEDYPYATIFLAYRIIAILVACGGGIVCLNVQRLMRPATDLVKANVQ
jgi:glycosyltransferase 2 family protein